MKGGKARVGAKGGGQKDTGAAAAAAPSTHGALQLRWHDAPNILFAS